MYLLRIYIIWFIINQYYIGLIISKRQSYTFTKIICDSFKKDYINFTKCEVSKTSGGKLAVQLYGKLTVKKIDNVIINAKLFRNINKKYRPFMYDDIIDFCEFQKHPYHNIFWNKIYRKLAEYSNINHSCPYEHDLIIKDLVFDTKSLNTIPLPRGEYMTILQFNVNNTFIGKVQTFGSRQ